MRAVIAGLALIVVGWVSPALPAADSDQLACLQRNAGYSVAPILCTDKELRDFDALLYARIMQTLERAATQEKREAFEAFIKAWLAEREACKTAVDLRGFIYSSLRRLKRAIVVTVTQEA